MAADFTVIQAVRQRFGDKRTDLEDKLGEPEAPFVGLSKDYTFVCPNVASGQMAVLQFETLGVTAPRADQPSRPRNVLQINGVEIPGRITSGQGQFWKAHTLLVPANVLREQNVLHIESAVIFQEHSTHHDDFIIDNVVVFFKTRITRGGVKRPSVKAVKSS